MAQYIPANVKLNLFFGSRPEHAYVVVYLFYFEIGLNIFSRREVVQAILVVALEEAIEFISCIVKR